MGSVSTAYPIALLVPVPSKPALWDHKRTGCLPLGPMNRQTITLAMQPARRFPLMIVTTKGLDKALAAIGKRPDQSPLGFRRPRPGAWKDADG